MKPLSRQLTGLASVRPTSAALCVGRHGDGSTWKTGEDERELGVFLEAIEQAQAMDRADVRARAAEGYDAPVIINSVITTLQPTRLGWSIETAASL
jgi:hypothetical protein